MKNNCFSPADILLPDFTETDGTAWAVIACDQFTGEPGYWEEAAKIAADRPSALRLILPECYLGERAARVPIINREMARLLETGVLREHKNSLIYLERTGPDGRVRRGLIGKVDLDAYDYAPGEKPLVRATEGTVTERIPPRVEIRRDAPVELPHIMLLIDDTRRTVIEKQAERKENFTLAYDFDLMLGGGHVTGYFLDAAGIAAVDEALTALLSSGSQAERYGYGTAPLLFAVGDGNHSLAAAKAAYEEVKATLGPLAAQEHPARYALVEVVNLHDPALDFEPIYRVVYGADNDELLAALREAARTEGDPTLPAQSVTVLRGEAEERIVFSHGTHSQPVGTLQLFLDRYLAAHPEAEVDYIHDEDSLRELAKKPGALGFLFTGMEKTDLFPAIVRDGALPRKTFSMGHARDKRYYLEARRIKA